MEQSDVSHNKNKKNIDMTREELLSKGDDWNLACDQALLNRLCDFSENLVKSSRELQNDCDTLSNNISTLSFKVANVTNEFLMLGNSQFVENCVQEFQEFDVPSSTNGNSSPEQTVRSATKSEKEAALIEKMKQAIQIGVRIQKERTELKSAAIEESLMESTSSKFSASVNIPHLIGSSKFFSSKYCGLKNENRYNPNPETMSISAKSSSSTTSSLNKIDAVVNPSPLNDDQTQYLKQPEYGNQTPSPNSYDDFVYPIDRTLPDFGVENADELNSSKTSHAKKEKKKSDFNSHTNPKPPYLIDTRISQPQFIPVQTKPPSTPSASSSSSSSMFEDNNVTSNVDFNSRGIFPPAQTISSQQQQQQKFNQPETEEEEPEFRSPHFIDMPESESDDDDIFKSSFKSKPTKQNLMDEPDNIFKRDISSDKPIIKNDESVTSVSNTSENIPKPKTVHQSLMEELQARRKNKNEEVIKTKPEEKVQEESKSVTVPKTNQPQQEKQNEEKDTKEIKSQVREIPAKVNNNNSVNVVTSSVKVLPSFPTAPIITKNPQVSNVSKEPKSVSPKTTTKTPETPKISNPKSQPEKKPATVSKVVSSTEKVILPESKISQQQQQIKPEANKTTTVKKSIFDSSGSDSDDLFSTKPAKKSSSAFKDKISLSNDLFSDVITSSSSSQQRQPPQLKAVLKSDSDDEDDFFKSLGKNKNKSTLENSSSSIKPIEKEKVVSFAPSSSQQNQPEVKAENPKVVSAVGKGKVLSKTKKSIFDSSDSDSDDLFSTKNTKSVMTASTKKDVFKKSSTETKGLFDNNDDHHVEKPQVVRETAESDSDGDIFKSKESTKKDEPKSKPQNAQRSLIDQLKARNKKLSLEDEKSETKESEPEQEKPKPIQSEIIIKPEELTTTTKIENKTTALPSLWTKNDEIGNHDEKKQVKQEKKLVLSSSSSESDLFGQNESSQPQISNPTLENFSTPFRSVATSKIPEKATTANSKPIKVQEKEETDIFSHNVPPPKLIQKPVKSKIANSIFDSSDSEDDDLFSVNSGRIKPPLFKAAASTTNDEIFGQIEQRPPPVLDLSDSDDDDDDLFKVMDDSKRNEFSFASSKPSSSSFSSEKVPVVSASPVKKKNDASDRFEDDPFLSRDAVSFDDILFPKNILPCLTKTRPKITHSRRPKTNKRYFNQPESEISTQELDPFA